ncbi:hypothetical protein MW887_008060 [Aspergillus wentii]|nr:hypothetical protein MW887_008060 [Aspergillus wentii]
MPPKRQPKAQPEKKVAPAPKPTTTSRKRKVAEVAKEASQKPARDVKRQKDVYVFGTNCYGELGLGDASKKSEIPGPVLNPKLSAKDVGVVHLAIGGVHSAALTHDNKILTWGVNDEGTLGRDTKEENPKLKEVKDGEDGSDSEDDDEVTLNLKEATPTPVDALHFPEGTVFTQLVATDSATFALTTEGLVYGWGTFRGANGVIGFSPDTKFQRTPALIPDLTKVTKLAAGAQHILALTSTGTVFTWGCAEQSVLGRRLSGRLHKSHNLTPGLCALPSGTVEIGVGAYHSFAIRKNGHVYAWGSNNFGQTAIPQSAGQNDAIVTYPTEIQSFRKQPKVISISGGKDHSVAVTEQGKCLSWGRIDNKALGLGLDQMPESEIIYDEYDRPRILKTPTPITGVDDEIVFATASSDHSFAITNKGQAYSWGFNVQYQAGHRNMDEVERPTLLQNKHVDGKVLVRAAGGGQFSMLMGKYVPEQNGV